MTDQSPEQTSIIGESPPFLAMMEHVSRAARLDKPVLVIGERGTGKELVASRLHYLSDRWDQPMVKLNCAALTESLLESELFGHEAGAFTGAARRHTGRFERAEGGTLLLDELAMIPVRMQEKILRVIEYGEFERVGGSETLRTDARVVGSTNQDLPALARDGRFRSDLLDRLAFDVITVPPLRARGRDLLLLAEHFALNFTAEMRRPFFAGFSPAAETALLAHRWPGNVRELKNTVERSVYRTESPEEPVVDIQFDPFDSPYRIGADDPSPEQEVLESVTLPRDFRDYISGVERRLIARALSENRYHQGRSAEALGLSYHQFRGYLKKYAIRARPKSADETPSG
ncbi:MAG: phage shock protein operon transcriptional activator [Chromatiales bacterium]|jgi:psp operon transcriptional activator|nr:phage shock protein operon transcriptional activator [Chromatiales bacterium]